MQQASEQIVRCVQNQGSNCKGSHLHQEKIAYLTLIASSSCIPAYDLLSSEGLEREAQYGKYLGLAKTVFIHSILVISLPQTPYKHRIYMVLANPIINKKSVFVQFYA
jgi:hypothetical protein